MREPAGPNCGDCCYYTPFLSGCKRAKCHRLYVDQLFLTDGCKICSRDLVPTFKDYIRGTTHKCLLLSVSVRYPKACFHMASSEGDPSGFKNCARNRADTK
jgi:hypothetical protein